MRARTAEIMGFDPQLLQMPLGAGEAVGRWLKEHHPINTAKSVARDAGVDLRTAENLLRGHLSALTFTKVVKAYGWPLLASVGAATIGETYEDFIASEIEAVSNARQRLEDSEARLRARHERLRASRAMDPLRPRLVDPHIR